MGGGTDTEQVFLSSILHCHLASVMIKISEDRVRALRKTAVVEHSCLVLIFGSASMCSSRVFRAFAHLLTCRIQICEHHRQRRTLSAPRRTPTHPHTISRYQAGSPGDKSWEERLSFEHKEMAQGAGARKINCCEGGDRWRETGRRIWICGGSEEVVTLVLFQITELLCTQYRQLPSYRLCIIMY